MSNPPAGSLTLQQAKDLVRAGLHNGNASGVVGVGIDPIAQKLLVFYDQKNKASQFLQQTLGPNFTSISQLSSLPQSNLFDQLTRKAGQLSRAIKAFFHLNATAPSTPISLMPASWIEPDGGDQGRVGCFVSLNNGTIAALTVEHLFHRRDTQTVNANGCDKGVTGSVCLQRAGVSLRFGGLQARAINTVDCALFLPDSNVTLKKNGALTGNIVQATQIANVNTATVTNLSSNGQGQVLDIDATIKFPVFLGTQKSQDVLLDGQILVKNLQSAFGSNGDSGALVLMAQDGNNNSFAVGDALGLYSAITATGTYHFVTPIHACMTALGATAIS